MHSTAFQAGGDSREPKGGGFAVPRMAGGRRRQTQTLNKKISRYLGANVPGRRKGQCTGPEAELCLEHLRKSKGEGEQGR